MSREERDRWLAAQAQQRQQPQQRQQEASGCPASEEARHAARINMPFVPNAPLAPSGGKEGGGGAAAAAAAAAALSTERRASSIPIADPSSVPAHQQGFAAAAAATAASAAVGKQQQSQTQQQSHQDQQQQPVWMYPSEQQFFNAMARKGWAPREADMAAVVAIHNAVNERAWAAVRAWEALHACECPEPKLLRFRGRPKDFSPKARLLNLLVRGADCALFVCLLER